MVFRREGGSPTDPLSSHWRERTRRYTGLPWLCRGTTAICIGNPRQLRRESIRAEDLQHPGKAGWAVLEECRWHVRRTNWRRRSESARRGLLRREKRLPRLL